VLTFAPQVDVGNALFKAAHRAGSLTRGPADQLLTLLRRVAWGAVADLSTDAARVSANLGWPAGPGRWRSPATRPSSPPSHASPNGRRHRW
jgi:hypothetical protein